MSADFAALIQAAFEIKPRAERGDVTQQDLALLATCLESRDPNVRTVAACICLIARLDVYSDAAQQSFIEAITSQELGEFGHALLLETLATLGGSSLDYISENCALNYINRRLESKDSDPRNAIFALKMLTITGSVAAKRLLLEHGIKPP